MNYEMITKIIGVYAELFSTLLPAGATVFAACVAIYGINAWRREFKGKRDIELAEEVLELFYRAKDAIRTIRTPWYLHEGQKVIDSLKADSMQASISLDMAIVQKRYEEHEEVFQKLQTLRYRFMAHFSKRFGKDKVVNPFDDLSGCLNRVFFAARALFDLQKSIREEDFNDDMRDRRRQLNADLWQGDEEKEQITPKVEAAVGEMEKICQKIIEGR